MSFVGFITRTVFSVSELVWLPVRKVGMDGVHFRTVLLIASNVSDLASFFDGRNCAEFSQ